MFMILVPYTVTLTDRSGGGPIAVLTASGEQEVADLCRILARSGYDFSVALDAPAQVVEPT